jgi:hypothetical protein
MLLSGRRRGASRLGRSLRIRQVPALRTVAASGLAAFAGLVALEHVLRPDLPPAERFISEYGRGWTQPIHVVAFGGWAVASGACAALAADGRRPRAARALTAGGFVVASAGAALAAAFATQTVSGELPAGVARTLPGRLHDAGTLLILGGLLVAAAASPALIRTRRYRAEIAALAVVLTAIVPVLLALGLDAPGLGQRAFVAVGCAFQWAFATQLPAAGAGAR